MDDLEGLAEERDRLRAEERNLLEELVEIRLKLREMGRDLQKHRKTRDELNETVKLLKKDRDDLRDSVKRDIAALADMRKSTSDGRRASQAERELAQLEWEVQTIPLEKDEEKRLMSQIRALESQVDKYRKMQQLRLDIEKHRTEADTVHAKIQEIASEGQKHHSEIVRLSALFKELKLQLGEKEKVLDEARERAAEAHQRYLLARSKVKEAARMIQTEKEKAHRESLKTSAKKKVSQGERISLHELGALLGEEE